MVLNSVLPRYMGSGAWKYRSMFGYTSVGAGSSTIPVRFNCPPEITLHYLQSTSLVNSTECGFVIASLQVPDLMQGEPRCSGIVAVTDHRLRYSPNPRYDR